MKRQKSLLTLILSIVILAACATPSPTMTPTPAQPADASWEKVQNAGKLVVGISPDYPPFEYYDAQYQFDGFDIALIKEVGKQLGLPAEFMPFAFDGLLTTVQLGQVDIAISAISVTPERDALVDFSNIYYGTTDAVLVRSDSTLTADTPDLLATIRLGVQQGSVYQGYAQTRLVDTGKMPPGNLQMYQDMNQAVGNLKEGFIEAVWLGLLPAQDYTADGSLKIAAQDLNQQLLAVALQQGSTALRDKVNEALLALQNNGTLARLSEQYLKETPEEDLIPIATPTPMPARPTPASPACMNSAGLVSQSPDDKNMTQPTGMAPGQSFTKTWRMINNGTCSWAPGYKLVYSSGNVPAAQMGGQPIQVTKEVKPGETFDFQVNLVAPVTPGTYQALWNMQDSQGGRFGATVTVGIVVAAAPTQTPSPNIEFKAMPTDIVAGETVTFTWKTSNVKAVYFYHDGQDWEDHPVDFSGQDEEDPGSTITYYLRVINPDNSETLKHITINVTQPAGKPVIEQFDATPNEIAFGQCVDLVWKVTQAAGVTLYLGNTEILSNGPVSGSYPQHCPPGPGQAVYRLIASGPGGSEEDTETVNVIEAAPPPTPTPEVIEPPVEPAAQFCMDNGGTLTTKTRGDGGQYGVCMFEEGRQCEEWAMYNGLCPVGGIKVTGYVTEAAVYCEITGGDYQVTGNEGASDEQGTCSIGGTLCNVWDYYNGACSP